MEGTLRRSAKFYMVVFTMHVRCIVIVGLPLRFRGVIYNVAAVLADMKIVRLVPKSSYR